MWDADLLKRSVAEFIGAFGLVLGGAGAAMADHFSGGVVTHVGGALASGLAVTAMIYATGHISGAHLNPAVTLGFMLTRHLPLREALFYWAAQLGGAIFAAGALRALLGNVANVGGHIPAVPVPHAIGAEVIFTFFLMFVIMAVATDRRAVGHAAALAIGLSVVMLVMIGGPITGGSMNPARSFGPALVGWSWTGHLTYWVGPMVGASIGAVVYNWLNDSKIMVARKA